MLGKIRDLMPESVKNPVDHQPSWTTSPRPNEGSHFSSTANYQISNTPMRNVGRETPIKEVDKIMFAR